MITDPRFAPKRADLPWLRHRKRPRVAVAPDSVGPRTRTADESPLADFMHGRSTHTRPENPPATPATPAPTPSASLDLDAPAAPTSDVERREMEPKSRSSTPDVVSGSLDLDDAPAAPASPAPVPAAPAPGAAAPSRPASSSSLDLDDGPAPTSALRPPADAPRRRERIDVRVKAGDRIILTPTEPTVTLTELQSGIGALTLEAAASDEVGDLRLGCAYEFDTGAATTLQSIMQMTQGNRLAPPHSKRPLLVGSHERFETVGVDLRQVRAVRRIVVYAFSGQRQKLDWGGTLVTTTFGGGRIEVPLDALQGGQVAVLMSMYQVHGELVLRAEMQTLNGDVREACRAYGFDRITWLDDRTPVD